MIPADAIRLLHEMQVDYGYPIRSYAAWAGIPEDRVRKLLAAFRALGWVQHGIGHSEDDSLVRGSYNWLTSEGLAAREHFLEMVPHVDPGRRRAREEQLALYDDTLALARAEGRIT